MLQGATVDVAQKHPALELLQAANPPQQAATLFEDRVLTKPLHLLPGEPDLDSKDARARRRQVRLRKKEHYLRKRKPRPLSAKERRKLGIHDIPNNELSQKWDTYLPLRDLWWNYMRDILDVENRDGGKMPGVSYITGAAVGPKLAAADYHGAELEVVRSNCVSRVGVRGIVLKDTKFTFEMITPGNELKTIPKCHTVFRFEVPRSKLPATSSKGDAKQSKSKLTASSSSAFSASAVEDVKVTDTKMQQQEQQEQEVAVGPRPFIFDIHGSHFETRAPERANKKFKWRRLDDL